MASQINLKVKEMLQITACYLYLTLFWIKTEAKGSCDSVEEVKELIKTEAKKWKKEKKKERWEGRRKTGNKPLMYFIKEIILPLFI